MNERPNEPMPLTMMAARHIASDEEEQKCWSGFCRYANCECVSRDSFSSQLQENTDENGSHGIINEQRTNQSLHMNPKRKNLTKKSVFCCREEKRWKKRQKQPKQQNRSKEMKRIAKKKHTHTNRTEQHTGRRKAVPDRKLISERIQFWCALKVCLH